MLRCLCINSTYSIVQLGCCCHEQRLLFEELAAMLIETTSPTRGVPLHHRPNEARDQCQQCYHGVLLLSCTCTVVAGNSVVLVCCWPADSRPLCQRAPMVTEIEGHFLSLNVVPTLGSPLTDGNHAWCACLRWLVAQHQRSGSANMVLRFTTTVTYLLYAYGA